MQTGKRKKEATASGGIVMSPVFRLDTIAYVPGITFEISGVADAQIDDPHAPYRAVGAHLKAIHRRILVGRIRWVTSYKRQLEIIVCQQPRIHKDEFGWSAFHGTLPVGPHQAPACHHWGLLLNATHGRPEFCTSPGLPQEGTALAHRHGLSGWPLP